MADWSHLPFDIIQELESHIESQFSTVRLRSTCSSWRHSIKSNDHNPSTSSFSPLFTKLTFLHLSPPPTPSSSKPTSWILKIHTQTPQRFHLYYPLSRTRIKLAPNCPPVVLDGLKTRVSELGFEFCYNGSEGLGDCSLYKEKVAFLDVGEDYLFLGIHVSGNLAVFSSVFMQWRLVDCLKLVYDDVIVFNGEFYAVDNVGKTVNVAVVVNGVDLIDCDVNVVANPICGGDKKRLVEVNGELMLVDVYIGLPPDDDINVVDDGWNVICLDEFVVSRSMWFRVYRLDRGEMSWVEVKDLGKNVLFLGVNSAFCVNADDLYWDKGNCIFFNFPYIFFPSDKDDDDDEVVKYHCGGVYQLEDISVSFPKVFWPPPSWVTSSS